MRSAALALICLACVGQARRLQNIQGSSKQESNEQAEASNTLNSLATFLMASNPAAGWQAPGAGLGSNLAMNNPVHAARSRSPLAGVADLPGISTECGNVVWDPLGLSKNADEENLNLLRAAELKHGRVSMLAVVGWVWTATGTHFNGMLSPSQQITFADCAAQKDPILAAAKVPGGGIGQIILAIGLLEGYWETKYPAYKCAGNYNVPAVTQDPAKLKELQTCELKHGRLAMIGIISFACAVSIPGSVPFYPF